MSSNRRDFKKLRYGESYGIPYRCLVPRTLSNVLVAGRCVSTDRYMQSSIRVMPGWFITGQAIGVAAAICDQRLSKPPELDQTPNSNPPAVTDQTTAGAVKPHLNNMDPTNHGSQTSAS